MELWKAVHGNGGKWKVDRRRRLIYLIQVHVKHVQSGAQPNHSQITKKNSSKNNAFDEFGLLIEPTHHFSIQNCNHGVSRI